MCRRISLSYIQKKNIRDQRFWSMNIKITRSIANANSTLYTQLHLKIVLNKFKNSIFFPHFSFTYFFFLCSSLLLLFMIKTITALNGFIYFFYLILTPSALVDKEQPTNRPPIQLCSQLNTQVTQYYLTYQIFCEGHMVMTLLHVTTFCILVLLTNKKKHTQKYHFNYVFWMCASDCWFCRCLFI